MSVWRKIFQIFVVVWCFLSFGQVQALDGVEVKYSDGETDLIGYLSRPPRRFGLVKLPAVIIVHEWWGHNTYARERADKVTWDLNAFGFAIDMYGEGKTADHPDDAKLLMQKVLSTAGLREKRFRAALQYLRGRDDVDPDKIFAIGYCFGGSTVLDMARLGLPLRGVASFHGMLGSEIQAQKIAIPIFVAHGADDTFISSSQISTFQEEMRKAAAPLEMISYAGAKHRFTNVAADSYREKFGMDVGYHERADRESWEFFKKFVKDRILWDEDKMRLRKKSHDPLAKPVEAHVEENVSY